jgi:hypothetical protein
MTKLMRYKESVFPEDASYHPTAVSRTLFLKTVDAQVASAMITRLHAPAGVRRSAARRATQSAGRRHGSCGARSHSVCASPSEDYGQCGFVLRRPTRQAQASSPSVKPKRQAWVTDLANQLYQADDGAYVGFVGSEEAHPILDVYPKATLARLTAIKKRYDPDNLFRLDYNIRP